MSAAEGLAAARSAAVQVGSGNYRKTHGADERRIEGNAQ